MNGSTRVMFLTKADAKPSAGSAIDHIGFSVADLDAHLKALQAAGVKVVAPMRDVEGLFKLAFVEDPWGTKIELVLEDPELLGLHHIHLRAPDPEQAFAWLAANVGGERTRLKGRIDAMRYRAQGFSDMWVLIEKGDASLSIGHAVDHVGWRSTGPLAGTVGEFRARGTTIETEPRLLNLPNGPSINFAYVAGPAGARVELVERPGLKPGQE